VRGKTVQDGVRSQAQCVTQEMREEMRAVPLSTRYPPSRPGFAAFAGFRCCFRFARLLPLPPLFRCLLPMFYAILPDAGALSPPPCRLPITRSSYAIRCCLFAVIYFAAADDATAI